MTFDAWARHFTDSPARQRAIEAEIDWDAPAELGDPRRRALVRSLQRFALGEDGDGGHLLAKAAAAGDPVYLRALELLVAEERRHAALFRRGLDHLDASELTSHWSDAVFTVLRRALGLRTEIALFLIAEVVAMDYVVALAQNAPDPVLRGIGRRVATDEVNHIRFQIDRLRVGFAPTPRPLRAAVGLVWTSVALGAATVLVIDHGAALRACGRNWLRTVRSFRRAARSALAPTATGILGPLSVDRWPHARSAVPA